MTIVDEFMHGLIETNRSFDFFVDWTKVNRYRDLYQDELHLLSAISQSEIDPKNELSRLLRQYPKMIALIPLLVAVRPVNGKVPVVDEITLETLHFNFNDSNNSIDDIVDFAERTGLIRELSSIKNPYDYYFGVEVGLDTNGRKNRSGTAMENLIEPFVKEFVSRHNGQFMRQINFKKASELFHVDVPLDESDKRGDFMLLINNKPINIEVNFFDGGGSKQEIMNSYIPRAENLKRAGWTFALVTDGRGWLKNRNQIELGYKTIKNILNAKMCREGKLENLLQSHK